MESSQTLLKLTAELQKLPGIGRKTAERLVYFLLKSGDAEVKKLATALDELAEKVILCGECGGITETDPCPVCCSEKRDRSLILVVEQPLDIAIFERTKKYNGLYHVLMGTLSPLNGIGPDDLRVEKLMERLEKGDVKEVIIATNPTMDGEATALYISKKLKGINITTSRIARGVPVGSDLEFVDEITLMKSLEGRLAI